MVRWAAGRGSTSGGLTVALWGSEPGRTAAGPRDRIDIMSRALTSFRRTPRVSSTFLMAARWTIDSTSSAGRTGPRGAGISIVAGSTGAARGLTVLVPVLLPMLPRPCAVEKLDSMPSIWNPSRHGKQAGRAGQGEPYLTSGRSGLGRENRGLYLRAGTRTSREGAAAEAPHPGRRLLRRRAGRGLLLRCGSRLLLPRCRGRRRLLGTVRRLGPAVLGGLAGAPDSRIHHLQVRGALLKVGRIVPAASARDQPCQGNDERNRPGPHARVNKEPGHVQAVVLIQNPLGGHPGGQPDHHRLDRRLKAP